MCEREWYITHYSGDCLHEFVLEIIYYFYPRVNVMIVCIVS
jgi:hypothetical protein